MTATVSSPIAIRNAGFRLATIEVLPHVPLDGTDSAGRRIPLIGQMNAELPLKSIYSARFNSGGLP